MHSDKKQISGCLVTTNKRERQGGSADQEALFNLGECCAGRLS